MKPYDPLMYIVVRRDLDMPAGKLGAQVAHAACRLIWHEKHVENISAWFNEEQGNEAKIVLGVESLDELLSVQKKADKLKIPTELVTDAAHTVFTEPTVTCLGIGPLTQAEAKKFKYLRLY